METVTIRGFTGTNGTVKATSPNCYYYNNNTSDQDYRDGVGGLIGFLDNGVLNASNITLTELTVTSIADGGTNGKNCSDLGSLVGTWVGPSNGSGSVDNVTLNSEITVSSKNYPGYTDKNSYSAVGGLFGLISDKNLQSWTSTNEIITVSMTNIHIADQADSSISVTGGRAGG